MIEFYCSLYKQIFTSNSNILEEINANTKRSSLSAHGVDLSMHDISTLEEKKLINDNIVKVLFGYVLIKWHELE